VVSQPTKFPYNEETRWCLKKFNLITTTIVRKNGVQITSLRPGYIILQYHLLMPTISLNEPFLKRFNKDTKYFSKLMEDWWINEDRKFKQG
jgi:hypothetical protein